MWRVLMMFSLMIMATGCVSTTTRTPPIAANDPFFAPPLPELTPAQVVPDGGIFHAASANSLYSDVKARRVGDIITVNLRENTNASKSAATTTSKETATAISPMTGLNGQNITIGGNSLQLGINSNDQFSGDASTNQSNRLTGSISVTVVDVLPNRNLLIRGEKWLTLNTGDEYIRLTGIIRPEDVSPTNQIESTKIANARIQYSGTGAFAQAQNKGWLSQFFNAKWWPF